MYEWTEASCGTRECMAEIGGIDDETLKDWRAGFEACKYDVTGKHDYAVYATAMNWQLLKSIATGCGLPAGTLKATPYLLTGAMSAVCPSCVESAPGFSSRTPLETFLAAAPACHDRTLMIYVCAFGYVQCFVNPMLPSTTKVLMKRPRPPSSHALRDSFCSCNRLSG